MSPARLEQIPAKERTRALFESLPVSLPVANIDPHVDHFAIASDAIAQLHHLQADFLDNGIIWRDLCALTGTFRTFYGIKRVISVWKELGLVHRPSAFKIVPHSSEIKRAGDKSSWVQAAYTFECDGNPGLLCSGFVAVARDPRSSKWKLWMFTTLLEQIKGHPSPDYMETQNGINEALPSSHMQNGPGPYDYFPCVIVGGGFSGLCIAGRLKALGVQSVVLEKSPEIGDNWKNRYESAKFHTTKGFSDFPLGHMFTAETPTFPTRLDLVSTYKKYVKFHGLNIWCSSRLNTTSYNALKKIWTLEIIKDGETVTVKTPHLVMAIGTLGVVPNMPKLLHRDLYHGEVLHSVDYRTSNQWKGKAGLIVGSANTAHDIGEDMVAAGLSSVTMIQRSPTPVFPLEWYKKITDAQYNEHTPMEVADRYAISLPIAVARQTSMSFYKGLMKKFPERLDALERAGFAVERSADMVSCTFGQGAGGHHTDVGGGAKIVAGSIKVQCYANPIAFTPTGLQFSDGSTRDADVIIFCTGFESNMRNEVTKLVGKEVGDQIDDFWGIDDEGELLGAFKRMKHPGIWYMGGGAPWARFGSRFLALQIKADLEGCTLPLYTKK